MTQPPETRIEPAVAAAPHRDRLLSPARYRHPGDVVRLIIAGFVLAGMLTLTAAIHGTYAGASATAVSAVAPSTLPGRVLAGLVQAVFVAAAAVAVVVTWRSRRYRLLLGLAGSAVLASAVVVWIIELAGGQRPPTLTAGTGPWPWLTGASLAGPALGAAAVAGTGFVVLGTVYLGTATVAAATPTPGGVGGFEAAAIVGLTGVGIANGPAVSAVVVYRLATYWLPVVPGLLAWRVSQRRGYV